MAALERKIYSKQELLSYRHSENIPKFLCFSYKSRLFFRKRGKRAGKRVQYRKRGFKPFLPKVIFGNVQSVTNKIDELELYISSNKTFKNCCAIGISESWADDKIKDEYLHIPGFLTFRSDRDKIITNKKKGGGVITYINEKWANDIHVKFKFSDTDLELLTLSIRPFYLPREFSNINITNVYINPNANPENVNALLNDILQKLISNKPNSVNIILGDFNHVKLQHPPISFTQYVDCATRKDKTLDLFYCNVKNSYKCKTISPIGRSDHRMVEMTPMYIRRLKKVKPITKTIKRQNDEQLQNTKEMLQTTDWSVFIEDSTDVSLLTDIVTSYITFTFELFTSIRKTTFYSNNNPWFSSRLKKLANLKLKSFGTEDFKVNSRNLKSAIKQAKANFKRKIENNFKNHESKTFWNNVKLITRSKIERKTPRLLCDPGIAEKLNTFYCRFDTHDFSKEREVRIKHLREKIAKDENEPIISDDQIIKIIQEIKPNKAAGPDKLTAKLIKYCKYELLPIVKHIFQLSLNTCTFPSSWKIGEIVPVSKITVPKECNDLRPVTLTSLLSKCLEKLVKQLVEEHVKDKLDHLQFAYQKMKSTDDAICSLTHIIANHLDKDCNNTVRCLFIDYSSAFNTVQPHLLIDSLTQLKVPNYLCLWILDFLTERKQYVRTDTNISSIKTLNTGAPQGCALSAFLFTIYTNSLSSTSYKNTYIVKYADDTAILGCIENDDSTEYNNCIKYVTEWCDNNFLLLNANKTKEMVFDFRRRKQLPSAIKIKGEEIAQCKEYKYLGVIIDDKLSFNSHIAISFKKANSRMHCIRVLNNIGVNAQIKTNIFNAFVIPVISYASPAFYYLAHTLPANAKRIEKWAAKLGCNNISINDACRKKWYRIGTKILKDKNHFLNPPFNFLPHNRRLNVIYCRTNRFKNTLIPSFILKYNAC